MLVRSLLLIGGVLLSQARVQAQGTEPAFNGKSLVHWEKQLGSSQVADRLAAIAACINLGSNGHVSHAMLVGLERNTDHADPAVRRAALQALGAIGNREPVFINKEVLLTLTRRLDDPDPAVRAATVSAAGKLAPSARRILIPELLTKAEHGSPTAQTTALLAIAEIGDARPVEPRLFAICRKLLGSADPNVRQAAVRALGAAEPVTRTGQVLVDLFQDPVPEVQANAAASLARLERKNHEPLDAMLLDGLAGKSIPLRLHALATIERIGPQAHSFFFPPVVRQLSDPEPSVRAAAARTLAAVGTGHPDNPAARLFQRFQVEEVVAVRVELVRALGQIGAEQPKSAVPPLLIAASDPQVAVRVEAVTGLANAAGTKPEGDSAAQAIAKALSDTDLAVRRAAAAALGRFDELPPSVAALLARAANDPDPQVKALADKAWAHIAERLRASRARNPQTPINEPGRVEK